MKIVIKSLPPEFNFLTKDILVYCDTALELSEIEQYKDFEINVFFLSAEKISEVNYDLRQKKTPTNILSINYDIDESILLGDIFICQEVLEKEAREQKKKIREHLIHLVVHSFLHLLGFDHEDDEEQKEMEELEIQILEKLGIKNPYLEGIYSTES